MESNFTYLAEWPEIQKRAVRAEKYVLTDPRASLTYARMALELAINYMYQHDDELEMPYENTLNSLIMQPCYRDQFPRNLFSEQKLIQKLGNYAVHNKRVSQDDSVQVIGNLFHFTNWFAQSYTNLHAEKPKAFNIAFIPKKGEAALSAKRIKELEQKMQKEVVDFQERLHERDQQNEKLRQENELFQLQLDRLHQQLKIQKVRANERIEPLAQANEANTRKYLIDVMLREAGWDLDQANVREFELKYMPTSTNKSGKGNADYVLWGNDGKPLAVIEAKRAMVSANKGENQAQLYAESLEKMYGQRPVMFYTNGYDIYIWDDVFYKQARQIHGFLTQKDLERLVWRRTNRKDIRISTIDESITDRPFQQRAIRSIAEYWTANDIRTKKLVGTNRHALLVLATGTGKTRTAISLCKILFEANWAKRILFLADRISLVSQAKRNFVKLLPDYSTLSLLEEKNNPNTRLVFSTYQTIMRQIDDFEGEERLFSVGHFDLIIVDEAHRSIYRKYQTIFEYFDALLLGLTATPKNRVDQSTYEVFKLPPKKPTDAYNFEDAVKDRFLVPFQSIEVPTRFMQEGIRYQDLSEKEKEEFENEILDGEEATGEEFVNASALNEWLFNVPTAEKTLQYILKHGIKKQNGEIGKTIIFARNRKHADFLRDILFSMDKALYGNEYVKVITHGEPKAEEMILRFVDDEKEQLPQIAISVDMLDTGIDAPSVVNLVFYKPVKSYSKFWQMIGRGSRLRPNLFGEGNHKSKYLIFDLCGNFSFFDENPNGIDGTVQRSITEIVFTQKLQLAEQLKAEQHKQDEALQAFRKQLLDELHSQVAELEHHRFDVRMKLKIVHEFGEGKRAVWNNLKQEDIRSIEQEIAPLIRPVDKENDMARFYDRLLYQLMQKSIEAPTPESFMEQSENSIQRVVKISEQLLSDTKAAIEKVSAKTEALKKPLDENYWKRRGIAQLEETRTELRELMRFLDKPDHKFVTTHFDDDLLATKITDYKAELTANNKTEDVLASFSNSMIFKSNRHRLEEIIRENANNITINRIRNGINIQAQEIVALENMLFGDKLKRKALEEELGQELNLREFIVSLIGLSEELVTKAFASFTNQYQLNSVQIEFLDTLKKFFTINGKIDVDKLYESPFKQYHSMAIEGVFDTKQSDRIFEIVSALNEGRELA